MALLYIFVYVFFTWVMYKLSRPSVVLGPETNDNHIDKYIWYYIFFFTLISAIRWRVGVDSLSYIHLFKYGFDSETKESLFYYLVDFIHSNHIHFTVGLGLCAFVQIFFTVKGILPAKYLLPYFAIVMFGGGIYLGMMNAVRQMMAAAIFVYAVRFISLKKPVIYTGLILLASMIHHSALILLPLYFIPTSWNITGKRVVLVAIFVACFIIGNTPQFQGMIGYLENITSFVGYDSYSSVVSKILDTEYTLERRAFGPMQISYFLCGLLSIWYGKRLHERYADKIPVFNLWYLFSTAYSCFYFLVCNVSHLLIRPIMYFQLFQTFILSLLLYDMFNGESSDRREKCLAVIFVSIIWVALCWDIMKNVGAPYECVIYKTSLFR